MASNINPALKPTSSIADFRFWCQKVLPLVYDDSLSYYEALGKMVVKINEMVDTVNNDADNVITLKNAFLALQTYVNEFFDDIDQLASYAERAEAAQTSANTSAANAATSASNASQSSLAAMDARDTAVAARQAAQASANTASTAATNANTKANEAAQSAITAQTAQASASQSATLAATDRSAAQTAASTATTKANEANTSATNAETSAENAAQSESNAEELVNNIQENLDNIQQNTQDISNLKESFTQLEDDVAETGVPTTTNSPTGEPAKFVSPIKNPIITELYTTLSYSPTAYPTGERAFVQYNGNEATGRLTSNKGLSAAGEIINSSGATLVGPIPVTENDTYFYMWWRKASSSGRITRAFAYNENDIATTLWNENYSPKQPTKEAEIPSGTKYIYASTLTEGDTIRASFRRSLKYITLPENFYGGKIDWIKKQIIQEYDASGNMLDTPIITSISDFEINTYKGENDYYFAEVSLLYLPSGTTTITYKAFLEEESNAIKSIIAKTIQDMIADTALVENDFRIIDNTLYRITTNVASGATLIPNTNCEETTVAAVLKSLLS